MRPESYFGALCQNAGCANGHGPCHRNQRRNREARWIPLLTAKTHESGHGVPIRMRGRTKKKPVRVNENLEPVAYFNVNWKGHTALGHDLEIIKAWASKVVKNIDEAVQKGARFAAGNLGSVWFDVDTSVDGKEKKVRVSASRVSAAVRPRHRPIIKYMIMLDATFDEEW